MIESATEVKRVSRGAAFADDATSEELQIAVGNTMTGIAWLTADGIFSSVRKGYANMLGYEPTEMHGISWTQTVPVEDQPRAIEAVRDMLRDGRAEVELNAKRKDGSVFYKKLLLVKTFDDAGRHNGHYCFMRDISARKNAEAALRNAKSFSDHLLDAIQDGVSVVDSEGRHIKVNHALIRMTGFSRDELIGRGPPHPYWPEEHMQSIANTFARVPFSDDTLELMFQRKDGRRFPVLVTPYTTTDEDGKTVHIATLKDISARKEAERRLIDAERLKTIGTLAGGIAHDLNNLLTPVLGYADALRAGALEVDEASEAIRDAAARAKELIDHILQFSRKDEAAQAAAHMAGAATEALRFARASLPVNVSIETHFESTSDLVACPEAMLQQVVMNLVSNAGHAMQDTGGHLTVRVTNPSQSEVALEVSDTGSGISEQMRSRIFEPFFTTKPVGVGTGLGLATVKNAVDEAGGAIEVESAPGRGSRFRITMPLAEARAVSPNAGDGQVESTRSLRVLLVDDQPDVLSVTRALLEHLGHQVMALTDPHAAMQLDPGGFDLMVSDYRMDGITGLDLVQCFGDRCCPAILMTGDRDAVADLPPVFDAHLAKPFTLQQLQHRIETALASRHDGAV